MTPALRTVAVFLGVVAVALWAAAMILGSRNPGEEFLEGVLWGTAALAVALIGAVIAVRVPRHKIGWLLLVAGFGDIIAGASSLYSDYADIEPTALPFADAVGWIGGSMWVFSVAALLIFLPLYFPTGRAPSPRWRWVGWAGGVGPILLLSNTLDVALFRPELMTLEWDAVEAAAADRFSFVVSEHAFELMLAIAPLALLSLIVRFIRSRGAQRQQIKLLVFAVSATVAFVASLNLVELPAPVEAIGTAVAMPSIGIATMFAILRHGLFDIDRVISRTVTYAATTAVVVAVYLAAVTALTAVTAPVTNDSPVAVAAATLLAAAAFRPARRRIQAGVDRRFNRARYDARTPVEAFAGRMRNEVDLGQLAAELRTVSHEALHPTSTVLWLREVQA